MSVSEPKERREGEGKLVGLMILTLDTAEDRPVCPNLIAIKHLVTSKDMGPA